MTYSFVPDNDTPYLGNVFEGRVNSEGLFRSAIPKYLSRFLGT
jgi:hypothetical protein